MFVHEPAIKHVSDTAIWVAYYRALESKRVDALFQDRLADLLVGTRGRKIAAGMRQGARYTQWSVGIRTLVIDQLIGELVGQGIDTVINLGAGLDTRPYRLQLPSTLEWIEADYPAIIDYKNEVLRDESPVVRLRRISLDLADTVERDRLFEGAVSQSKNVLVLTEGVIPYLSENQVGSLARWLWGQSQNIIWITEFISPVIYPYLQTTQRVDRMRNAPFKFFPADWFGFFKLHGWVPKVVRYLPEEAAKVGRPMPLPWWARLFHIFMDADRRKRAQKCLAFAVLVKGTIQHGPEGCDDCRR